MKFRITPLNFAAAFLLFLFAYFITKLRQKVEDDPDDPKHIVTVRGVGYKFVP